MKDALRTISRFGDRADAWLIDAWTQEIPWNRQSGETISAFDRNRLAFHGTDICWVPNGSTTAQEAPLGLAAVAAPVSCSLIGCSF